MIDFFRNLKLRMSSLERKAAFQWLYTILFLTVLCTSFFMKTAVDIRSAMGKDPSFRNNSDSRHYLVLAREFEKNDFRFRHVDDGKAHRQPLYPFLLSLVMKAGVPRIYGFAKLNVFIVIMIFIVSYLTCLMLSGSVILSTIASLLIRHNTYLYENVTHALLTEPLFILLSMLATWQFIRLYKTQSYLNFTLIGVISGLAYLTRTNGLMLFLSLFAVSILLLFLRHFEQYRSQVHKSLFDKVLLKKVLLGSIAMWLSFIAFSSPTWVPRVYYKGNPIYHEYLPNYLWVDTYEEGHVPGPPRFGPSYYFETHNLGDVIKRFYFGHSNMIASLKAEDRFFFLYMGGLIVLVFSRSKLKYLLFLILYIQMLPLIWTKQSNPNFRIPYTVLFPFSTIAALILGHFILQQIRKLNIYTMKQVMQNRFTKLKSYISE